METGWSDAVAADLQALAQLAALHIPDRPVLTLTDEAEALQVHGDRWRPALDSDPGARPTIGSMKRRCHCCMGRGNVHRKEPSSQWWQWSGIWQGHGQR